MRDLGKFYGGMIRGSLGGSGRGGIARFNDAKSVRRFSDGAIATGATFLVSELERREPDIKQPLTSVTYPRDIPLKVGGGWVEYVTALNIDFGVTGGASNGLVNAPGANGIPVVQMNLEKDTFSTHVFTTLLRVPFFDMQRMQVTGKSLDALLTDGIRLSYDKHMDANVYIGLDRYGTEGLLNNSNVIASDVADNEAGTSKRWADKTADEILKDINDGLIAVWTAAQYDMSAIPNHVLIPHEQYNALATRKVSPIAEKTILEFLLENNIAKRNGTELFIGACPFCNGRGASNTDRMVIYRHDERFLAVEELVPLSRIMTQPNTNELSYDSVYSANISEVELFYNQTIRYYDGI